MPALLGELKQITIQYAKQETLDPLKGLLKFLAFGIAGALLLGIGLTMWALSLLRALQTETGDHLADHLTWVPYVATLVACLFVAGLSGFAIGKEKRRSKRRRAERERRAHQQAIARAATSATTGGAA